MEKNSKTIIINNLQKTLNLLEKIDLTGGVKLTPKQLQERVEVYLRTKEEILGKINQISRKLGLFKQSYTDTQSKLQRISAQKTELQNSKESTDRKIVQLTEENTQLNNTIEIWDKWQKEENQPAIKEYKRQLKID